MTEKGSRSMRTLLNYHDPRRKRIAVTTGYALKAMTTIKSVVFHHVVWWLDTDVSEDHATSLKMEVAQSSETSVSTHYTTWRNNTENRASIYTAVKISILAKIMTTMMMMMMMKCKNHCKL
jgi:hypothetical protein